MTRRFLGCAVVLMAACGGDPVLTARRVLEQEPQRAVSILSEATATREGCFDCWLYLGLASEKVQDYPRAAAAYERALALPESARRPENVREHLLWVYQQLFTASKDPAEREAIARKAAPLEVQVGPARAWANEFLFESLRREFSRHASAGDRDQAIATARAIQALYLPAEKKAAAAKEATEFLRTAFARTGAERLRNELSEALVEKGFLTKDHAEIRLYNEFKVPSVREDPAFDPSQDSFPLVVRSRACLPLRARLQEAVDLVREGLHLRAPDAADLDRLFAKLYTYARAGYLRYGAEQKPAGKPFFCSISVPVEAFAAELFRFSE